MRICFSSQLDHRFEFKLLQWTRRRAFDISRRCPATS